ncbi:hypothetical protein FRC02_010121 [Tulasnella sp. 418]|nr:hypothetical protein FRC02_010121 [Tulasnella sp. 418]
MHGHTDWVRSVAFSHDSRQIVSGSHDKTVCIWDAVTGTLIKRLEGHTDYVQSVAFSHDSRQIVSGSHDETVCIWDAVTGTLIKRLEGHTSYVRSVAFSHDSRQIVSGSHDETVCIWDAVTGTLIKRLEGHTEYVQSVAFSHDSRQIVSGSRDKTVCIWDAVTGTLIKRLEGHTEYVQSVAFSHDSRQIVSGSRDKTVCIWDAVTGTLIKRLEGHTDYVQSVAFSHDSRQIVSGSYSVAFSPDGTRIASGTEDGTIAIWDAKTGILVRKLEGHSGWVNSVAFSPDGMLIASGSDDGDVATWDTTQGSGPVKKLERHRQVTVSDRYAMAGGLDSKSIGDSSSVAFSTNATFSIASDFGDQTAVIRKYHTQHVCSVAISPQGKHLVSASWDTTICLFHPHQLDPIFQISCEDDVSSVAFSLDGQWIASGSWNHSIYIFGTQETYSKTPTMKRLRGHTDVVSSVSFSPIINSTLISGSWDQTIRVWDYSSEQLLATLEGHRHYVSSVGFVSNGAQIVSASLDSSIRIWDSYSFQPLLVIGTKTAEIVTVSACNHEQYLLSLSINGIVSLWNAKTGAEVGSLQTTSRSLSFVAVGGELAIIGDELSALPQLWQISDTISCIGDIQLDGSGSASAASFSGDGTHVLFGFEDGSIQYWSITQLKRKVRRLEDHPRQALQPTRSTIIEPTKSVFRLSLSLLENLKKGAREVRYHAQQFLSVIDDFEASLKQLTSRCRNDLNQSVPEHQVPEGRDELIKDILDVETLLAGTVIACNMAYTLSDLYNLGDITLVIWYATVWLQKRSYVTQTPSERVTEFRDSFTYDVDQLTGHVVDSVLSKEEGQDLDLRDEGHPENLVHQEKIKIISALRAMFGTFQWSTPVNKGYRRVLLLECATFLEKMFYDKKIIELMKALPKEDTLELFRRLTRQCDHVKLLIQQAADLTEESARKSFDDIHQEWLQIGNPIGLTSFVKGATIYETALVIDAHALTRTNEDIMRQFSNLVERLNPKEILPFSGNPQPSETSTVSYEAGDQGGATDHILRQSIHLS